MPERKGKHTENGPRVSASGACAAQPFCEMEKLSGAGGGEGCIKEEAKADQWERGEERRQQMSVGRGAKGGIYGEAGAGPEESPGWGRGAGGWRDWFKGQRCRISVPGRGGFVCLFCFSLKLCPLFSVGFSYASALWEPALPKEARM